MEAQNKFIELVQEYLENKKNKNFHPDSYYLNSFNKLGFDEEKSKDILLKMDDEWTIQQQLVLESKNAKHKYILGVAITTLGLFIFIYSYFFYESIVVIPLGLIGSGIVYLTWSKTIISNISNKSLLRKTEWKRWAK